MCSSAEDRERVRKPLLYPDATKNKRNNKNKMRHVAQT